MSTYTPIASQTLTGSAASVTFSGVPQNFTDLILVTNADVTSAGASINIRFNSDSGSNYSYTTMYGNGSTVASARGSNLTKSYIAAYVAPNTALEHTTITHIQNYSNATTNKTFLSRSNRASASNSPGAEALVGLWRNTSAINTIFLSPDSGSFDTGSTFNLYGIVSGSAKATGGTVTTDGTYYYHTFTSSGIFTPSAALTADCLVVAGGGAGAWGNGGGGGAGGLTSALTQSLTAQNYSVIVGAGAARITNGVDQQEASGSNSIFNSLTAIGGGGGATFSNAGLTGVSGGSGGGGGGRDGTPIGISNAGGGGTAGQGNAGGYGYRTSSINSGGGGGGAGAAGSNAPNNITGGNGGIGSNSFSTWASATSTGISGYYAGGGGGGSNGGGAGTGGTGGGGAGGGGNPATGTAGTANTGGGGGGGGGPGNGSNGGSGLVIIRYAV